MQLADFERVREIQLADYKKCNWQSGRNTIVRFQEIQLREWEKYSWQITRNTIDRLGEIQLSYFRKYNWQSGGNTVDRFWEIKFALTGLDSASCSQGLTLRFVEMRGKLLLCGTYISRLKKLENGIDSKKDEGKGGSRKYFPYNSKLHSWNRTTSLLLIYFNIVGES